MNRAPFLLMVLVLAGCSAEASKAPTVPYPSGYRSWTHVKSTWLGPEHGLADPFAGLHHVYVNRQGAAQLRAGEPLPDGSVLVFDLRGAELSDHAITEGPRKLLGVMRKDRDAHGATGGWGFEAFRGASETDRLVDDGGESCFACHQSQKPNDYVFTRWRD